MTLLHRNVPVDLSERPGVAVLPTDTQLFYLRLRVSGHTVRPLPGVFALSVRELTSHFKLQARWLRRHLDRLQAAGLVLFDEGHRLLFCVGAIEDDPPRSALAMRMFQGAVNRLPDCAVRNAIEAELTRAAAARGHSVAPGPADGAQREPESRVTPGHYPSDPGSLPERPPVTTRVTTGHDPSDPRSLSGKPFVCKTDSSPIIPSFHLSISPSRKRSVVTDQREGAVGRIQVAAPCPQRDVRAERTNERWQLGGNSSRHTVAEREPPSNVEQVSVIASSQHTNVAASEQPSNVKPSATARGFGAHRADVAVQRQPSSPPVEVPVTPRPIAPQRTTVTARDLAAAWSRNPVKLFGTPTARDFEDALKMLGAEKFELLVRQLGVSKWKTGEMSVPQTLRKLLDNPKHRERVLRGEYAAPESPPGSWRCVQCNTQHKPLAPCPPKCGCGFHHGSGYVSCWWRREQQAREWRDARIAEHTSKGLTREQAEMAIEEEHRAGIAMMRARGEEMARESQERRTAYLAEMSAPAKREGTEPASGTVDDWNEDAMRGAQERLDALRRVWAEEVA